MAELYFPAAGVAWCQSVLLAVVVLGCWLGWMTLFVLLDSFCDYEIPFGVSS